MRVTISAAPSPSRIRARSALPTIAVTRAPERAASLHGEIADAASGAGNQHSLAEQRGAVSERAQRGQAGDRQGSGGGEGHIIGERREAAARHRGALGPAFPIAQRDDPRAGGGAGAVGRLFQHHAGDVLAGAPARGPHLEQAQLAAVERKRAHRDQRLVRARFRLRHLADRDRLGTAGGVDDGEHGMPSATLQKTRRPRRGRGRGPSRSDGRVRVFGCCHPHPASGFALGHPLPEGEAFCLASR